MIRKELNGTIVLVIPDTLTSYQESTLSTLIATYSYLLPPGRSIDLRGFAGMIQAHCRYTTPEVQRIISEIADLEAGVDHG